MQTRCNRCFNVYEKKESHCPFCGYSETDYVRNTSVLQPGTLLKDDRFILGEQIGQGAVGIVYRAWDKRLHRVIAIKEFFPETLAVRTEGIMAVKVYSSKDVIEYERRLSKFKREAMIMNQVTDSENCIRAYDTFEANGTVYITMEYYDAPKLSEYLQSREGQVLPEKEVNAIMLQLLKGVDELHGKGIYHLDLSPDNIFIRKDDDKLEIKIFSFDNAVLKADERKISEAERKENSGFAAPELYGRGGNVGSWTDVYSLGAVYYYLLTGRVPQDAAKREKDDVIEPAQMVKVSDWVNAVVTQALAVVQEQRYTDAGAFREALVYRMERAEKDLEEKKQKQGQKKCKCRLAIRIISLFIVVTVGVLFALSSGETTISMWVVSDTDAAVEKARYEAVIEAFQKTNPDIKVSLEVMTVSAVGERLQAAEEQEMPDLVETTYVPGPIINGCKSLSRITNRRRNSWVIEGLKGIEAVSDKQIPLGFYVSVRYKQPKLSADRLQPGSTSEFIKGEAGYVDSDTTIYSMMQRTVPGRYEVAEAEQKELYLAEMFSVSAQTRKNEKAAKALLEFMMTDEGQEIMHVTYNSNYLPIEKSIFELYVIDVFTELRFLNDTINMYEIVQYDSQ